jgi:cell division septal protein FtsQ
MLFNRKLKNRRLGREHVLDVKLRSTQVRAARNRVLVTFAATAFCVVFGVYVLWRASDVVMDKLIYENNTFAIQDLSIQTDGNIPPEQLRKWAGVRIGQNLFALDLARVRRDLLLVPLIHSVSIERILPRGLRIQVVEREAIAQMTFPRTTPNGLEYSVYHVDPEGWVMLPLDPRQRTLSVSQSPDQMPVLRGVKPNEVLPGRRLESPSVHAALQLIEAFERSPMNGWTDLKSIDVSAPDVLTLTTGQGSEITFAFTDLEQQLRRWHRILEESQRTNVAIAWLDLAVSNNIPVRFLEASVAPAMLPRTPKPLHFKKKHV